MSTETNAEVDERFPSGKWVGFFLDRRMPGKHQMELNLHFAAGQMTGEGRDRVGEFVIVGNYDTQSGECKFAKQYINAHGITYRGFNEGKGIWGTWELVWGVLTFSGGFHIWPEGMADPTILRLFEEIDEPIDELDEAIPERRLRPVGV